MLEDKTVWWSGDDLILGRYDPKDGDFTREFTGQGWVYKNGYAFESKTNDVCYIAELDDEKYTYSDFVKIANGNISLAEYLFEFVDWQSPSTLLSDLLIDGVIDTQGCFL